MSELPPWDPDEYDRRILRERLTWERTNGRNSAKGQGSALSTIHYTRGVARGVASDDEVQRRVQVDKAMKRRNRKRGNN